MTKLQLKSNVNDLLTKIDKALDEGAHPLAAFDADGTLWENDMGEAFFKYQIENCDLKFDAKDPWAHYFELQEKVSKPVAYLYLAQVNQGYSIEQVRAWAEMCLKKNDPTPVISEQLAVVNHLYKRGVEVYVVTASVKWAVEPAALKYFGIEHDHVIGIETHVENGVVTDKQKGLITYKDGKIKALLEKTQQKHPFFAAGNTSGDIFLLEGATHERLVVATAPPEHDNYKKEQEMVKIALKNNWNCWHQ